MPSDRRGGRFDNPGIGRGGFTAHNRFFRGAVPDRNCPGDIRHRRCVSSRSPALNRVRASPTADGDRQSRGLLIFADGLLVRARQAEGLAPTMHTPSLQEC